MSKLTTVAQLIAELQKCPADAPVFAMTAAGPRPAHVVRAFTGAVHVLGEIERKKKKTESRR